MTDPKNQGEHSEGTPRPIPGAPPTNQPDQRTADGHHNQQSAVRGSGDQNPGDIYKSDRDREGGPNRPGQ